MSPSDTILILLLIGLLGLIWWLLHRKTILQDTHAKLTSNLKYPGGLIPSIGSQADAMLLTCLDYRFFTRIDDFMIKKGFQDRYDAFILAGSSLGLNPQVSPMIANWQKTWWNHLELAYNLHKIKGVIIIDHEDCGAYKEFLGYNDETEDLQKAHIIPASELQIHSKYLREAYRRIKERYPDLTVELYMIGLYQDVVPVLP